jgi:molybdate transport system regulatory protein
MNSDRDPDALADRLPVMHLRLWLDTQDGLLFGPGRAELLELIDRYGSLRQAVKELGISYRAAWGKLRKTEKLLGYKLVDKAGSYKEGYRLTPEGRALKEKFDTWYREVENDAIDRARTIFTCDTILREHETEGPTHLPGPDRSEDKH